MRRPDPLRSSAHLFLYHQRWDFSSTRWRVTTRWNILNQLPPVAYGRTRRQALRNYHEHRTYPQP